MQIKEIMTTNVRVISPDTTIKEAAEQMRELDIGALPVCDGTKILGILTDRDIATRCVAAGHDTNTTKVQDMMTKEVIYIYEDQDVLEAARLMEVKGVRRLVVLNRDKKLVGFISLGDVSIRSGDQYLSGEVLERISEQPAQHVAH